MAGGIFGPRGIPRTRITTVEKWDLTSHQATTGDVPSCGNPSDLNTVCANIGKSLLAILTALEAVLQDLKGPAISRVMSQAQLSAGRPWASPRARRIYPFPLRVSFWCMPPLATSPLARIRMTPNSVSLVLADDSESIGLRRRLSPWRLQPPLTRKTHLPRSPTLPSARVINLRPTHHLRNAPVSLPERTEIWMTPMKNSAKALKCICTDPKAPPSRRLSSISSMHFAIHSEDGDCAKNAILKQAHEFPSRLHLGIP